jgi:PRTRC genetic system protein B
MSFEVQDCAANSVRLQTAILLYGSDHGNLSYATIHPVDVPSPDASPVIRAGRPADSTSLKEVCASLISSARIRSGLLSDNVLSIGLEHVVWWSRPGQRTYFFNCREAEGVVSVGKRGGTAPAPGLIFVAKEQSLWVYAVKGDSRPTLDTPLYHAPFMNVWDNSKVCLGSMPLPDATLAESVAKWEKSFWESNFSHPNHPKPLNYKGGIHQFSLDLLNGKFKDKYPERVLRPIKGLTLGAVIDHFDGIK